MNRDFENNSKSFENTLLSILKKLCDKDEPIHTDYLIPYKEDTNTSMPKLMVDFFLPNGCKAMYWKGPVCVEGKSSLTTTAIVHARALLDLSDYQIIIVTDESVGLSFKHHRIYGDERKISWYSLSALYQRLNTIKKEASRSSSDDTDVEDGKRKTGIEKNPVTVLESNPEDLARNAFKNGNITLFLGAGVSVGAGLPQW